MSSMAERSQASSMSPLIVSHGEGRPLLLPAKDLRFVAGASQDDLVAVHDFGPRAVPIIAEALTAARLSPLTQSSA